ncbi:transglycosylase SLT domain-containing protein [Kribbella qitaiheensis]|uniref:transglycosylase SLT domain-containing protein n=1 Tax=Kribbella qitaiheensis TaxID=1544730 RepID=UPI0019D60611|nr:transglycosylase SLT domain-containing protein [Kribbella qitaiheensis]
MSKGWWWVAVGAVVVAAWVARGGDSPKTTDAPKAAATVETPKPSAPPKPSAEASTEWYRNYDPAQFAVPVRKAAGRAGVSPQLLMAILYNEDYKPHNPQLERSWQHLKPDAAFGIANMHRAAFDDTKRGRSFAGRNWDELPDHPELAIEAAAWHLHDLAARVPRRTGGKFSKDELLALGYNTGARNMRAFAAGAKPGSQAQSYLDDLHKNLPKATKAITG